MCGIFGVIGQGIIKEDITIFKELMLVNSIRGPDSTGFVSGRSGKTFNNKHSEVTVVKKASDPLWFLQNMAKEELDAFENTFHDFKLGHDRWATTGEVSIEAAHPFNRPNIIGTHNGTFYSLGKHEGYHSDSDAFFAKVDELGMRATIQTMRVTDKYALVWYDKNEERVKFLRNSHKMFWFCYHPNRNVLYYSSELGCLRWIMERHAIKPEDYWFPREDTMYTIDPQTLKKKGKPFFGSVSEVKPFSIMEKAGLPASNTNSPWNEGPSCDV